MTTQKRLIDFFNFDKFSYEQKYHLDRPDHHKFLICDNTYWFMLDVPEFTRDFRQYCQLNDIDLIFSVNNLRGFMKANAHRCQYLYLDTTSLSYN